jgi:hypothetical protein
MCVNYINSVAFGKMCMKLKKSASGRLYPWSRRLGGFRSLSGRGGDYGNSNVTSRSRTPVVAAWSVTQT